MCPNPLSWLFRIIFSNHKFNLREISSNVFLLSILSGFKKLIVK